MKRRTTKRPLWAVAAISLALVLPLSALARPPGGRGGIDRLVERLDLDTETRAAVDAVVDASRVDRRALGREIRALREEMRGLMQAEESDEAILVAQAERISALELSMEKQRIATFLELRTLLGAEQMERLGEMRRALRERRGAMR